MNELDNVQLSHCISYIFPPVVGLWVRVWSERGKIDFNFPHIVCRFSFNLLVFIRKEYKSYLEVIVILEIENVSMKMGEKFGSAYGFLALYYMRQRSILDRR